MRKSVLGILILSVFVASMVGVSAYTDEILIDDFNVATSIDPWGENQITANWANWGVAQLYGGQITSLSDPYMIKPLLDYGQNFSATDFDSFEFTYMGYANGPTRLGFFYKDGVECIGANLENLYSFDGNCAQYWSDILWNNGSVQNVSVKITDNEWLNGGNIQSIRFDFEDFSSLDTFYIDNIKFYKEDPVPACGGNPDQLIMRLSADANAHGSTWDGSSYSTEICYNDFWDAYVPGASENPHDCTGTNRILSLSGVTNAHAGSTYTTNVCYGDLVCTPRSGSCEGDEIAILTLSDVSNAHLALYDDSNYLIKVCCEKLGDESISFWFDANGEQTIGTAQVGDDVMLVRTQTTSGNFVISEDDGWFGSSGVKTIPGIYDAEKDWLYALWNIEDASDGWLGGDMAEFYFEIDGVSGSNSGILFVSEDGDDDKMEVTITRPQCGSYFDVNEEFNITINADDPDSIITGNLTVNGEFVSTFTNGVKNFTYSISDGGNYQIRAEGWNSNGDKAMDISNIMILNSAGYYVAACVTEPENYESFPPGNVDFDASSTVGVEVTLAGSYVPIRVSEANSDERKRFSWYWTILPEFGSGSSEFAIVRSYTNSNSTDAYIFSLDLPASGRNRADLIVNFGPVV